jgi:hypothetical protein
MSGDPMTLCEHGKVMEPEYLEEPCPECNAEHDDWCRHVAIEWIGDHPAEAVKVLLETGALEQCGWRFEAKRPSGLGYRYGFMTYIEGEAGHHDHVPVYRLANEEST